MAIWYTYFVVICYIIPILVYCIKKNLATLLFARDKKDLLGQKRRAAQQKHVSV
jgi:hypothetical protein